MMITHRLNPRKTALRSYGALFLIFLALSLLFSLLQPGPALAQEQGGDVWFTVMFQEGGDFKVSSDGEDSLGSLQFVFISYLDPIDVYKGGRAYNEYNVSDEDDYGSNEEHATFEGEYNSKTKTLTGRYESSYSYKTESYEIIENFTGTLEGTLEYRPQQYSGDELVDTIFTMRGKIKCTGQQERVDLDEDEEDESYVHDMVIDYDFVANGNTGPEDFGGGEADGGGSKIPGPGSWWEWLTVTVIGGAVAAGTGLVSTFLGGGPPPTAPAAGPTAPPDAPGEKPEDEATDEDVASGDAEPFGPGKKRRTPGETPESPLFIPPDMEPPSTNLAEGTADPFDTQKYPDQPAYIGDAITEVLDAAKDAVIPTTVDAATALKDGVVGFVKGIASIPLLSLEGFVQIGRLTAVMTDDAASGRQNIFSEVFSSDAGWDMLKKIPGGLYTVLKEFLPIDEISSFFDPNASLEECLWAIPAAIVKITNVIMMSPKLAVKPVPGLSTKFTLIKSAKPSLVAKAALQTAPAGLQKGYDAYKAAANAKAKEIVDTVMKGGKLTREQVLDAMSDPATMRILKKAPDKVQNVFNKIQGRDIYNKVKNEVTGQLHQKNPGNKYGMDSVRTPGQKSAINTDNDAIVKVYIEPKGGKPYWKEVPAKQWEEMFNKSFANHSGYSLNKAKAKFPEIPASKWDSMTKQERYKAWAEGHGQACMDVKNPEAAHAFSDQPTAMDPKWRAGGKSPVADGRMVDGEGLHLMEKYKTRHGWVGDHVTLKSQTEAMEQGCKLCNLSKKLTGQSMARTGKYIRYPEAFKQGEEILNMRDLHPQVRDAALKNIGFKGGYEEFMGKLSSWTGTLP